LSKYLGGITSAPKLRTDRVTNVAADFEKHVGQAMPDRDASNDLTVNLSDKEIGWHPAWRQIDTGGFSLDDRQNMFLRAVGGQKRKAIDSKLLMQ
jgi:hypothetical protein